MKNERGNEREKQTLSKGLPSDTTTVVKSEHESFTVDAIAFEFYFFVNDSIVLDFVQKVNAKNTHVCFNMGNFFQVSVPFLLCQVLGHCIKKEDDEWI